MTDLVADLAKQKYAPAKRAVYDTVFFWFGYDDTMTAHPALFELKAKLEKDFNKRALAAATGLAGVQTKSMVFLSNRKELAADPRAEPIYTVLVHVETTSLLDEEVRTREQIAAKLKIPAHCVGLSWGIKENSRYVNNLDARLDTQPAYFLMWQVCTFLKNTHDANDDRFLRWAVENRRLGRGLASEIIPELFPPVKLPDRAIHLQDAEHLAAKVFAHYGIAKLGEFTSERRGAFKALLDANILSKDDGVKIMLHKFEGFSFRKIIAFSRRYELTLHYQGLDDELTTSLNINHLGKVVPADKETDTCSDIAADVKTMWSVDAQGHSPQDAIEAASRVLNTVKPKGMTRDKIVKLIGDASFRPKGIYNSPFFVAGKNDMVLRFDTGVYGWQFNLRFDEKDICSGATRIKFESPVENRDPRFDEELERDKKAKSEELDQDLKTMWRTVARAGMKFEVAPVSAINAASRVFNSVELLGKSKAEIDAILKYEPRAKYGYNFAFFPAPGRVVYRFDCGNFGWQFNISLNADGKATAIERKWIH